MTLDYFASEQHEADELNRERAAEARERFEPKVPLFAIVSCSQCGREFRNQPHGFSHCQNHRHLHAVVE